MERIESPQSNEGWQEVLKEVNKIGKVKKTLKQCKDKIKTLKQAYKDAKMKNKETGQSPQRSPFYDDLDEVLGTRAVITMPGVKQVGQSATSNGNPSTPGSVVSDEDLDDGSDTVGKSERMKKADGKCKRKRDDNEGSANKKKRDFDFGDLIEAQNKQIEMLDKCQERTENLLLKLEMDQRKADDENRNRDREFLFKMAALFAKNK